MLRLLFKIPSLRTELHKVNTHSYAEMADRGWADQLCVLKNLWVMYALSFFTFFLALIWGGMSLLLWSALPLLGERYAWVLWVLPLSFFGISLGFGVWARGLRSWPVQDAGQEKIQLNILRIRQVLDA